MRRFGIGLVVGMAVGLCISEGGRHGKQLLQKVRRILVG